MEVYIAINVHGSSTLLLHYWCLTEKEMRAACKNTAILEKTTCKKNLRKATNKSYFLLKLFFNIVEKKQIPIKLACIMKIINMTPTHQYLTNFNKIFNQQHFTAFST